MLIQEARPLAPQFLMFNLKISVLASTIVTGIARGIWKVLSMVFYLRNRFTNPIMLGIILKCYLSFCYGINFMRNYNADMTNIIVNTCTFCILEKAKFQWKI